MIKTEAITAFFANLSKRERTILYVTVFVVSLTLLDLLVIIPIFDRMGSLDREISDRESAIKKNMRILSQKDKIDSENKRYSAFLTEERPEEEETTAILKEIEDLANKSSVYLVDMKPSGVKKAPGSKKFTVNVSCEGEMVQLAEFMYEIENSKQLMMVEKYSIAPKSKDTSVAQCSLVITKICMFK